MTAAFLAALGPLIAALAPVLAQWLLRRWAAKDDPRNQLQTQLDENRQAIANGAAGELLDERLNRLRPPAQSQGPGPKP